MIQSLKHKLQSLITLSCLLCRSACQWPNRLCRGCIDTLPRIQHACMLCSEPLPHRDDGHLCGTCQKQGRAFDSCTSAFLYQSPVSDMLQRLKYHDQLAFAHPLATQLASTLQTHYRAEPFPEVILPIPLHRKRLLQRGYNQSTVLARHLSRHMMIPTDHRLLKRVHATQPQLKLTTDQRRRNVRGTFTCKRNHYHHVALLDDIVTTGATVEEISRLLKQQGVKYVDVWCIARTPPGG
ncbi:MAG: hypothetical protein B0D91_14645 [Oceanospirillales bacterium LUC14_002_19_P2]|nr:MAG: hypothetical protein B0D91_14645 [Oceanospirillales bacterium LUC14_002_19_P2]